jgi:hypothetical protein
MTSFRIKTSFVLILFFALMSSGSAQDISADTQFSSTQTLSATGDTAKTAKLTVNVVNDASTQKSVSILSGVCSPGEVFQYTDIAAGCVDEESTISDLYSSPVNWIDCSDGSVTNSVCRKEVSVPSGGSVKESFTVEVPVGAEQGVYDASTYVVTDSFGVVEESHRGLNVGGGSASGLFVWLGNLTANLFSLVL